MGAQRDVYATCTDEYTRMYIRVMIALKSAKWMLTVGQMDANSWSTVTQQ